MWHWAALDLHGSELRRLVFDSFPSLLYVSNVIAEFTDDPSDIWAYFVINSIVNLNSFYNELFVSLDSTLKLQC